MKLKASKSRTRPGKPAKRVSAIRKKRAGPPVRQYLVRCWWILRGAVVGALALGILYGAYLGAGKIIELDSLSVRTIDISGCQNIPPDSIRRLTGILEGEPLLKIDLKKVRRKVVSHPAVKDATVVRELPGTLRISVQERVSAAVVLGREFALVDSEGVVLSLHASYPEGYPVITGITESMEAGRMIMEAQPAMEVLRNISRSGFIGPERISELVMDGNLVRVSLMGSGTVLVLRNGDTDNQMKKLVRLMEAGVFDARSAGYDLRFKDRVISMPERKHDAFGENGFPPAGG